MIVLALSSGTSADGIDAAVVSFAQSGDLLTLELIGSTETPWSDGLGDRIRALYPPAATTIGEVAALNTLLGQAFARAALGALDAFDRPDLIVSHGQTVFHWVEDGEARGTLQLGEAAWIAEATGVPVLSNVRARDIAAGGQGAPLMSTFDALWLRAIAKERGMSRVASVNLGGIANVSVWTGDSLTSYDTGPANCLIDDAVRELTGNPFDRDGTLAGAGVVREDLLGLLLADPYFSMPAPKSTGREYFRRGYVDQFLVGLPAVSDLDLIATLTELTVRTVADQLDGVDLVIASGGGVRNRALMESLARRLGDGELATSADFGVDPDAKEACLFALLGYLSATGQPGTTRSGQGDVTTTGAAGPRILGDLTPGDGPLRCEALLAQRGSGSETRLQPAATRLQIAGRGR